MVQEVYVQHPVIQQACENVIFSHARTFEATIEDARRRYAPESAWTAESLSLYIQASIQGAFILAKAKGSIEPAVLCLEHLERYVELVFSNQQRE
jgi:TetR/AcrR family transcriptional repressor of nem operon